MDESFTFDATQEASVVTKEPTPIEPKRKSFRECTMNMIQQQKDWAAQHEYLKQKEQEDNEKRSQQLIVPSHKRGGKRLQRWRYND